MEATTKTIVAIGIVLVALVAVVIVAGPRFLQARRLVSITDRCATLQAGIATARANNDHDTARRLAAELAVCNAEATAAGASVDVALTTLTTCSAAIEQLNVNFDHYRATSYLDTVKRDNTRGAILSIGGEMARCFQRAVDEVNTMQGANAIKRELVRAIGFAVERFNCYAGGGIGCGRFGFNEENNPEKARAEETRVIIPLRTALQNLETKMVRIDAAERLRAAGVNVPATELGA